MSFITEANKVGIFYISQLHGNVKIGLHDEDTVKIETTEEDKVEFKLKGHTLYIKAKEDESDNVKISGKSIINIFRGNRSVINIGKNNVISGSNITINGNNISVGNISSIPEVDMKILVPKNCIHAVDVSGQIDVEIDGISNSLTLDQSGQTSIEVKNARSLSVDLSGQSKLYISNAELLDADISGQSNVQLEGKEMSRINVDASGQSDITLKFEKLNKLNADLSGMCSLTTYGKIEKKDVDTSGMCSVKYR